MKTHNQISKKLNKNFNLEYIEILNESHMHNVDLGSESHFKIVMVSSAFKDQTLVKRHQLVYTILVDEIQNGIHALALHMYTPTEWKNNLKKNFKSPDCASSIIY